MLSHSVRVWEEGGGDLEGGGDPEGGREEGDDMEDNGESCECARNMSNLQSFSLCCRKQILLGVFSSSSLSTLSRGCALFSHNLTLMPCDLETVHHVYAVLRVACNFQSNLEIAQKS